MKKLQIIKLPKKKQSNNTNTVLSKIFSFHEKNFFFFLQVCSLATCMLMIKYNDKYNRRCRRR